MSPALFRPFQPRAPLSADDLNTAFRSALEQIPITAGAPRGPGLFRPFALPPAVSVNRFTLEGDALVVGRLCVVLPGGHVVVDRDARIERVNSKHSAYLTADGDLEHALAVPDGAFALVRRTGGTGLETVARIAALDADAELSELCTACRRAAGDWRDALHQAGPVADEALTDLADATALNDDFGTRQQCGSLMQLSRALSRRMTARSLADPRVEAAASGPRTDSRPELVTWLKSVLDAMSDGDLRAAFLGTGGWCLPSSVRPGETLAGGLREVHFDLEDVPGMHLEIASPEGFANSRWRFGPLGRERAFVGTTRAEDSWRARLSLSKGDPRALFVWTDAVRPQDLRFRMIASGGKGTP